MPHPSSLITLQHAMLYDEEEGSNRAVRKLGASQHKDTSANAGNQMKRID